MTSACHARAVPPASARAFPRGRGGAAAILASLALATVAPMAAAAQGRLSAPDAGPRAASGAAAPEAALRRAISDQLAALREGDFAGAFAIASPQIQARFLDAENFARMVRRGYPMVMEARRTIFGALSPAGSRLRQSVLLIDEGGRVWAADYLLVRVEGRWRIDGVSLRPARAQDI